MNKNETLEVPSVEVDEIDVHIRQKDEILKAEQMLFDQVWYNRHMNIRIAIKQGEIKVVKKQTKPMNPSDQATTKVQLAACTVLTMFAFASNSLLCRMALKETSIDAASYTSIQILSGAAMLWLLMCWQHKSPLKQGTWFSAAALFIYAVALSFSYRSINAGAGALMLFGAVQLTMILAGFISGERMSALQSMGFVGALAGLVILVFPGVEAPSIMDSILMLASGIAWGVYPCYSRYRNWYRFSWGWSHYERRFQHKWPNNRSINLGFFCNWSSCRSRFLFSGHAFNSIVSP